MQFGDNPNCGIYLYIACNKPMALLFENMVLKKAGFCFLQNILTLWK